jgi:hypothetical protein
MYLPVGLTVADAEATVSIFPNPSKGTLNISYDGNKAVQFLNSLGILVKTIEASANTISISDLGVGMYFIKVFNNGKLLTWQKIIYED